MELWVTCLLDYIAKHLAKLESVHSETKELEDTGLTGGTCHQLPALRAAVQGWSRGPLLFLCIIAPLHEEFICVSSSRIGLVLAGKQPRLALSLWQSPASASQVQESQVWLVHLQS